MNTKIPRRLPAARAFAALLILACALTLAPPAVLAAATPVVPIVNVSVYQGETISFDFSQSVVLVHPPTRGALTIDGSRVVYQAFTSAAGRDRFKIAVGGEGLYQTLEYRLRVVPRKLPVAGYFGLEGIASWAPGPGYYDSKSQAFILCELMTDLDLTCRRYPVVGLGHEVYVPLVLPGQDLVDELALFDIGRGVLHFLERSKDKLEISESLATGFSGTWPAIGDWDGTGPSLALVFETGRVVQLGPSGWTSWFGRLVVPPGDGLVWPIPLPRKEQSDAMALVDPGSGNLYWAALEGDSLVAGIEPSFGSGDFSRPLVWKVFHSDLGVGRGVFFLRDVAGRVELQAGRYMPAGPQTLPVKFPDDPSGGG